ncbi:MAG: S-layer family protein [Desulfobacterales bacterium]|nr:S-layer family protein [Desulfobacterales bacterium]
MYSDSTPKIDVAGDAGGIIINAKNLTIKEGAVISSSTMAGANEFSGQGGDIELNIKEQLTIDGINTYGENEDGFASAVSTRSRSEGNNAGDAGKILIQASSIELTNGGQITNSTFGQSRGGDTVIHVDSVNITGDSSTIQLRDTPGESQLEFQESFENYIQDASISGIYARSESPLPEAGEGGEISIFAKQFDMSNSGKISTSSAGGGKAGNIEVNADQVHLNQHASISSESESKGVAGDAGIITVIATDEIQLTNMSDFTTEAINAGGGQMTVNTKNLLYLRDSRITTSVQIGAGDGGDINIDPKYVSLNQSKIIANAYEGRGGNIHIVADRFIQSLGSIVDASSKLGIDGTVEIISPDVDVSSELAVLPDNFLDATQWASTPCSQRLGEKVSRFVISTRDGIPSSTGDWLASPPVLLDYRKTTPQISQVDIFDGFNSGYKLTAFDDCPCEQTLMQ